MKDNKKCTAVHLAAFHGHPLAIRTLKEFGVDISSKDILGNTPLHFAVSGEKVEAVRMLILLGGKLSAKNKEGKTPLSLAQSLSVDEAIELSTWRTGISTTESRILQNIWRGKVGV